MPSSTADGLPYPLPSEPVRDGAVNIQALATAVGVKVQSGSAFITTTAGSSDGYIPFPVAFRAGTTPAVIMQSGDPANGAILVVSYYQFTDNTRAALRLTTPAGGLIGAGTYRIQWHAIGYVT